MIEKRSKIIPFEIQNDVHAYEIANRLLTEIQILVRIPPKRKDKGVRVRFEQLESYIINRIISLGIIDSKESTVKWIDSYNDNKLDYLYAMVESEHTPVFAQQFKILVDKVKEISLAIKAREDNSRNIES